MAWASWAAALFAPAVTITYSVWIVREGRDDPGDSSTYGAMP